MDAEYVRHLLEVARAEERAHCEKRIAFLFGGPSDDGRWHWLFTYLRMVARSEGLTPYDLLWNLIQQHTRHDQETAEDASTNRP